MAYDLYLGKMLMPIAPSKIQMAINNKNQVITLINDGELNLLKSAGLTDIQFTLLIPQVSYPFARYGGSGFVSAENYLNYFEQLKTAKEPFQFIISRCLPAGKLLFDTNITASLEDYTITEEAKNGFDLEVSISLKQYKHFATKTISVEIPSPTAPIIVNENRPIIWNPTPSTNSSSGGSSSGSSSSGGSSLKSYKVQIIGMGVVTVKASSPADAITKAAGDTWKGTIYVDGIAYNGATKQKITGNSSASNSSSSSNSSNSSGSTISKVVSTVSQIASSVGSVISKVASSAKNAITNVIKKNTSDSSSVKSTPKSSGGTNFSVVMKR